tara:strand:+ start:571 stop:714 length:144 start_codon:yes stop_codon:yes gene_type:complete
LTHAATFAFSASSSFLRFLDAAFISSFLVKFSPDISLTLNWNSLVLN